MYMKLKPNKHKIISFNTRTMTSLGFIIVGTFLPPFSPHIKGGVARRREGTTFFATKGR